MESDGLPQTPNLPSRRPHAFAPPGCMRVSCSRGVETNTPYRMQTNPPTTYPHGALWPRGNASHTIGARESWRVAPGVDWINQQQNRQRQQPGPGWQRNRRIGSRNQCKRQGKARPYEQPAPPGITPQTGKQADCAPGGHREHGCVQPPVQCTKHNPGQQPAQCCGQGPRRGAHRNFLAGGAWRQAFYQPIEFVHGAKLNYHLAHFFHATIALDALANMHVDLSGQQIGKLFFQATQVA